MELGALSSGFSASDKLDFLLVTYTEIWQNGYVDTTFFVNTFYSHQLNIAKTVLDFPSSFLEIFNIKMSHFSFKKSFIIHISLERTNESRNKEHFTDTMLLSITGNFAQNSIQLSNAGFVSNESIPTDKPERFTESPRPGGFLGFLHGEADPDPAEAAESETVSDFQVEGI